MIDECKAPLYAFLFFINGSVYIIYITPSFQILDNEMRSVIDRKDLYESILMSLLKSFKQRIARAGQTSNTYKLIWRKSTYEVIIKRNFLSKTYVYREASFYDFSAWSLFYMFTPTLCGPAYGTIQRKIVVKLRFYNDLLLFEGLFEDPREGFLKPISGERGQRTKLCNSLYRNILYVSNFFVQPDCSHKRVFREYSQILLPELHPYKSQVQRY